MNTPASCSLSFVFARRSTKTVILRRGPSRLVRCILWDRADDSFEDGQWLDGAIPPDGCSLSADGHHLMYVASKQGWRGGQVGYWYTVISRPPWLTALALFPNGMGYGMGGYFLDERRYLIDGGQQGRDLVGRAEGLEQVFQVPPDGSNTLGLAHADGRRVNLRPEDRSWLSDPDRRGPSIEGYVADGGKLMRQLPGSAAPVLIRDFTDMTFAPIRAPYDWRDTDGGATAPPWHPLDADDR